MGEVAASLFLQGIYRDGAEFVSKIKGRGLKNEAITGAGRSALQAFPKGVSRECFTPPRSRLKMFHGVFHG